MKKVKKPKRHSLKNKQGYRPLPVPVERIRIKKGYSFLQPFIPYKGYRC